MLLGATTIYMSPAGWIFWMVWLGLGIYVAVDAGKLPDWAFERAGTKKSTWQVWPIVSGVLCCIPVLVFAIMWFSSKKAQVEAAARGGGAGGPGYGAPTGYGYPGATSPGWTPPPAGGPTTPPGYTPWPGGEAPPPAPPPAPPQGPPPGSP